MELVFGLVTRVSSVLNRNKESAAGQNEGINIKPYLLSGPLNDNNVMMINTYITLNS